ESSAVVETKEPQDQSSDDPAGDSEQNVHQRPIAGALHDLSRRPSSDEADQNHPYQAHKHLLMILSLVGSAPESSKYGSYSPEVVARAWRPAPRSNGFSYTGGNWQSVAKRGEGWHEPASSARSAT